MLAQVRQQVVLTRWGVAGEEESQVRLGDTREGAGQVRGKGRPFWTHHVTPRGEWRALATWARSQEPGLGTSSN